MPHSFPIANTVFIENLSSILIIIMVLILLVNLAHIYYLVLFCEELLVCMFFFTCVCLIICTSKKIRIVENPWFSYTFNYTITEVLKFA